MHRTTLLGFALTAVALTGCSTTSPLQADGAAADDVVALTTLGPASGGSFFFGAGDALGQEIFTYYVASLHSEQLYYATGESQFIE